MWFGLLEIDENIKWILIAEYFNKCQFIKFCGIQKLKENNEFRVYWKIQI